jgi:hypothetical protein
VKVTWVDLDHLLSVAIGRASVEWNQDCSFWETMAGLGSIAKIAVSSANLAVVMSGEDARLEV